jgi:hypothetical protein
MLRSANAVEAEPERTGKRKVAPEKPVSARILQQAENSATEEPPTDRKPETPKTPGGGHANFPDTHYPRALRTDPR